MRCPTDHPQKKVLAAYKKDYESEVQGRRQHVRRPRLRRSADRAWRPSRRPAGRIAEKVRDAIENLKGFVGTAGIFNFSAKDHTGLDLDAFEMLTVKDGKFAIYKK